MHNTGSNNRCGLISAAGKLNGTGNKIVTSEQMDLSWLSVVEGGGKPDRKRLTYSSNGRRKTGGASFPERPEK